MALSSRSIIMISITAIVASIIVPIGVAQLASAGSTVVYYPNGTSAGTLTSLMDANVLTLLQVVVPLVVIISLILAFVYNGKRR